MALAILFVLAFPCAAWGDTGLAATKSNNAYSVDFEVCGEGEAELTVSVNGAEQIGSGAVAVEGDSVSVSVILDDPKTCAIKSFVVSLPDGTAVERERADAEVGSTVLGSDGCEYQYAHVYTFSMPASDVAARCELAEACTLSTRCTNRMDNNLVIVEKTSGDVVEVGRINDPPPSPYTSTLKSSGTCNRTYYVVAGEYDYRLYNAGELYESGTVAVDPGKDSLLEWLPANVMINGLEIEGVGYVGTGDCYYTAKGAREIRPVFESRDDYGNYNAYFVLKATEKGADYAFHVTSEHEGCAFRPYTAQSMLTVFAGGYVPQQRGWWQACTNEYRVTVPEGSDLHAYRHPGVAYKEWSEVAPASTETANGKTTYAYDTVSGYLEFVAGGFGTGFAKTYWSYEFQKESESVEMEVPKTGDDSHEIRDKFNGLYLSVADDGYRQRLDVGEEFTLEGFRVYQPTLSVTSNHYVEPDMHYEVIAGDSVSVSEVKGGEGRHYVIVKAERPGVSIVKVTYDESYVIGYSGSLTRYAAIAPEQTGIVVFDVGGADSSIYPGIDLLKYDTVYFADSVTHPDGTVERGEGHGEYTITPSVAGGGGVTVETHKPYQLERSFEGSTWEACAPSSDGSFTVPLYTGRNIIRISSGGAVRYFVVNAMATDVVISNRTSPGQALRAGDEASVSFSKLELPVQKMTAIYNPGWYDPNWGMSEDSGTYLVGQLEGPGKSVSLRGERTQYSIRAVSELSFTVPEAGEFEIAGAQIHSTHMGSGLDAHCGIPLTGLAPNTSASNNDGRPDYCVLPDVRFCVMQSELDDAVAEASQIIAALPVADDLTVADAAAVAVARAAYDALSLEARTFVPEIDVLTLELAEAVIEKLELQERIEMLGSGGSELEDKLAAAEAKAKAAKEGLAKAKAAPAAKEVNPMELTVKAKTLKAKKLSKKAQTFKAVTVKGVKGKVTYAKVKVVTRVKGDKKKISKKFAVNKKTGKITVKKGLKMGVYKVTVRVKAAGDVSHKTITRKVTVRVVIK